MSTILSKEDLNDFIAPGVACIKPVEIEKSRETAEIAIGDDGQPLEEGRELAPAQISLQDCLACSGCITSSEAMLVELQSPKELLSQLEQSQKSETPRVFIASVSHQTRVSLAKAYGVSIETVDAKLKALFVDKLGFRCVLGTEIGRAIALEESWQEIAERRGSGVVLSSICPGWTLYAEKTHPEILDMLSTVRSPQQITGMLAKRLLSSEIGVAPENIYHVSVMPCFDKKLESSRPEFALGNGREVDLVVTAKEIVDMLTNTLHLDFMQLTPASNAAPAELVPASWPDADQFKSNEGSSSGGYLAYLLHKTQMQHPDTRIVTIPGKNSDFVEFQVLDATDKPLFRGAQVYGFRNIQNLVRKLKSKRVAGKARAVKPAKRALTSVSDPADLDYVELMACPGGCVNGGGQIGAPADVPVKVWTQEVNAIYAQIDRLNVSQELVEGYYAKTGTSSSELLLRTHYRPVERDESLPAALTLGTQW